MDDHERDLEDAVEELSGTLQDLRSELREPSTGPLGVPRPPTPGEFLRFTERYTLPALISLLETGIRVLELLSASIRLVQDGPIDADRPGAGGDAVRDRRDSLASVGRTTLEALDDALAELQTAAAGGGPGSPELQRLLEDARELGAEVDARLANTADDGDEGTHTIEIRDASADRPDEAGTGDDGSGPADGDATGVDVDAELESIKDELDAREQPGEAHGATEDPLEDADGPESTVADDERDADGDTGDADGDTGDADDADDAEETLG